MESELELVEMIQLSGIRKEIARRMIQSKRDAPHAYYDIEVNMKAAKDIKDKFSEQDQKITYNDIIIFAVSRVLKKFPRLNAHIEGDKYKIIKNINIGIAVGLNEGLIVPVIRDTDKKELCEISKTTKKLIQHAKLKKLKLTEYTCGTFTVSNLGMFDIKSFHAIINPPEVAILAVGKVANKATVYDNNLVVRLSTNLSLSADHRIIDGMEAAKFMYSLKSTLENIKLEYKE